MLKKIFILTVSLLISNTAFAGGIYKDISKNSPYYKPAQILYERGLMRGFADGTFKPYQPINRGDYSKVIVQALKLDNMSVVRGVPFYDLDVENPYYDAAQIAIYYDLIMTKTGGYFYPKSAVLRKDAFMLSGNYLSDKLFTKTQARNILGKYTDRNKIKDEDLVLLAKADVLGVLIVTTKENKINPNSALTRGDFAILLNNLLGEQKITANQKMKYVATKKKSFGTVIKNAITDEENAILPVQAVLPVQILAVADSQKSQINDEFEAIIPWNVVTKDKYLMIQSGAKLKCKVTQVNKRKFLRKNGNLRVETTTITTKQGQTTEFPAVVEVDNNISLANKIFKFKRIKTQKSEKTDIKMLKDIKIDLTSGLILK